ncbi:MAG: helix-turn-helix transcriptional regulator [Verrucomicrobia bacterium]|nr:helix-turn-helix transcriptional regulator [Verrucomicrobiota bacterium]
MKKNSGTLYPSCPVETTLLFVGDRWKILIIRDLMEGTKRFGELRRRIGNITQKTLTNNLRAMEAHGIVHRKVFAEIPPKVEYSLTSLGKSLKPVLDSMAEWGINFKASL